MAKRTGDEDQRSMRPHRRLLGIVVLLAVFALGNAYGTGRLTSPLTHQASVKELPAKLDYTQVTQVYDALRGNYNGKLTEQQVIDGLKQGLAESTGDPYTEYFTASKADDFQNQLNNSFSGIGAELGKDSDSNLIVVSPIAGFPADKAGLKAQDIITTINGESATGLSIDDAVGKIRGKKDTQVKLVVVRNKAQTVALDITRDNIQIPSVDSKILDDTIGYVTISTFADDTGAKFGDAAQKFKDANVKGIILDLRGNPGGLLDAAVSVSSQWLPKGKTVLTERGNAVPTKTYSSDGSNKLGGIPTVVLINEGSASASEITAGALRDNSVARLIGVKSYGKGVVQQIQGFKDGSELKVTVASWYRPNGQNINHKGISPDQEVKLSDDDAKNMNDTQKNAAIEYLKTKQ